MYNLPKTAPTVALEVVDFDAAVAQLKKKKIKFIIGPSDGPLCRRVGIRDPDGNKLTLHQRKKK